MQNWNGLLEQPKNLKDLHEQVGLLQQMTSSSVLACLSDTQKQTAITLLVRCLENGLSLVLSLSAELEQRVAALDMDDK
jgi:hypothetical protein